MHTMFRLPTWGHPDAPGDKIMEKATLHKSRPMSTVDLPQFKNMLKRKPADGPEPATPSLGHVVKKWKGANGEVKLEPAVVANGTFEAVHVIDGVASDRERRDSKETPTVAPPAILQSRPMAHPSRKEGASQSKVAKAETPTVKSEPSSDNGSTFIMDTHLNEAQQAIEAQFNYEILIKHNELRLIEQELAKCQVALEQLRRCSVIPYPGTEGLSLDVSGGVGPALQPPSGYTEPQYAAPWGVTDGPYTRHYAKWLIPDPAFDSMSERALAQHSQGYFGVPEGRTTRGSVAEFASGRARTSRTSTGTLKLQALGENLPPAPIKDPLLHKRSTDGQWVRLYCAQCGHSNFSNTQGFLNHCRIKHNQVFKSHDQAAIACGVPVDVNESGNPVSMTEPTSSTTTTPAAFSFPLATNPGSVHPLIRSNPLELAKDVHRNFDKPSSDRGTGTSPTPNPGFVAAASAPRLSSVLAEKGFHGDLKSLIDASRLKIDLNLIETSDDDCTSDSVRTPSSKKTTPPSETSIGTRVKSENGGSSRCHVLSPVNVQGSADTPAELSPHPVESNPGLVSDNDDDDDEDGYDARSQSDVSMADAFVIEDGSDVEGAQERAGSRKGLEGCFAKGEGSRKN